MAMAEDDAVGDMMGLLGVEKAARLWEDVGEDLIAGMEGEGVRREALERTGNEWEGVRPLTGADVAA